MSVFRKVTPTSLNNASRVSGEFMLCWISDASLRQWFFSSTDGDTEDTFKNSIIETETDIRSIPTEERKEITCVTMSLDSITYDYVSSLLGSNRVYQLNKDGSKTPVAVKQGKKTKSNIEKEFIFKVVFLYKESYILNA